MRIAAFDFGSNSLKCLLADFDGAQLTTIFDKRITTRLGAELNFRNELSEPAIQLSLLALNNLFSESKEAGAEHYLAVGTEALRRAKNAGLLVEAVKQKFGLELKVISGSEEAELSRLGAAFGLKSKEEFMLFDSGGSSTEFSYGLPDKISYSQSLPLGAVSLTKAFLHSDPPNEAEIRCLKAEITTRLSALKPCQGRLLGVGGGITACAKIALGRDVAPVEELNGHILSREELNRQTELFLSLPLEQRKWIPGMEAERADIIVAASILYSAILSAFGKSEVSICSWGLRYGLIIKYEQG